MGNRTVVAAWLSLFAIVTTAPAFAGVVGAKKPSEIVTLHCAASGTSCVIDSSQGGQFTSDGLLTTGYTIPAGQVLVLTSVTAAAIGPSGTSDVISVLFGGTLSFLLATPTYNPTIGAAAAQMEFPTGIVVKPGALSITIGTNSATFINATWNGYLTKDK